MNLWKIGVKNWLSNPLNTLLSIVLTGLSIALIGVSFHLKEAFNNRIQSNILDIDMVMGAKGSPLQLVLSSVLHIDNPTGNINYHKAKQVTKSALVKSAIPVSYGDNYKGYRIVGTTTDFLTLYKAHIVTGTGFKNEDELVVGANVAAKLHLKIGDEITSSHGLLADATEAHEDKLLVKGILAPTGTVADNLILTPLATIWHLHEHKAMPVADEDREITAMLVSFKSPMGLLQFPRRINSTTNMQAALPKLELERLFSFLGVGFRAIALIGVAILLVSGLSIFISMYKMVNDRKYELALLRTYGAGHIQLLLIILIEGLLTGILGYVTGVGLSKLGLWLLKDTIESAYRYSFNILGLLPEELYLGLGVMGITIMATLLAVVPIFKMNVSKILANES